MRDKHETAFVGALLVLIVVLAMIFLVALPGCQDPSLLRIAENADAIAKAQAEIRTNVQAIAALDAEISTQIAATASLDVQAVKVQAETLAGVQANLDALSKRYEALEQSVGQAIAEGPQNLGSGTQFILTGGSWAGMFVALIWGWANARSHRAIREAATHASLKRPKDVDLPWEFATALDNLEAKAERRRRRVG